MATIYEWCVEHVCGDEVLEHYHQESYAECLVFITDFSLPSGSELHIVLVRDDDKCRSWAYIEDTVLPERFTDAYDRPVAKVPKRYHTEVARSWGCSWE